MTRRTGTLRTWLLATILAAAIFPGWSAANEWPREIDAGSTSLVVYRPVLQSLEGDAISARTAVMVSRSDGAEPIFGAVWFDGHVAIDREAGIAHLVDLEVSAIRLPDIDQGESDRLARLLESEAPGWDLSISMERLFAELDIAEQERAASARLGTEPPEILFATYPAVLVVIDGKPILENIKNTAYDYVVNTPFFIARSAGSKRFYLKGGGRWYAARDLKGDWTLIDAPPPDLAALADRYVENPETQTAFEVGEPGEDGEPVVPRIIVTTEPAELVQTDGEPEYAPIEGTSLLYLTNTDNDVIMDIDSQRYYLLLAGRWYASGSLARGDWTFVPPDELPAGFPDIPVDSDMGSVRTSIAGTEEAREAVLSNQIPRVAAVDREDTALEVSYDGVPRFAEIEGTNMFYALNTDKSVLLIDGRYYCCDDAVWFVASSPWGPWEVCVSVPSKVRTIPPSCPAYPVKYVHVYYYTPEIVYVGYTPGYLGSYILHGCVVYGTGYAYRPWYGRCFYPHPFTYGFNVHYSTAWGWGFSYGMSLGWFRFGLGSYPWGWWGPAGYCLGYRHGYWPGHRYGYRRGPYYGYRRGAYYGYRRGPYYGHRRGAYYGSRHGPRQRYQHAYRSGYDRGARPSYRDGHHAGRPRVHGPNTDARRDRIWRRGVRSDRGYSARTEPRAGADRRRPRAPDHRLGIAYGQRSAQSRSGAHAGRNRSIDQRTDRRWARYARPEQYRQGPVVRRPAPGTPHRRAPGGRTGR